MTRLISIVSKPDKLFYFVVAFMLALSNIIFFLFTRASSRGEKLSPKKLGPQNFWVQKSLVQTNFGWNKLELGHKVLVQQNFCPK